LQSILKAVETGILARRLQRLVVDVDAQRPGHAE
jgi:hypothetical protein